MIYNNSFSYRLVMFFIDQRILDDYMREMNVMLSEQGSDANAVAVLRLLTAMVTIGWLYRLYGSISLIDRFPHYFCTTCCIVPYLQVSWACRRLVLYSSLRK